MAREPAITFRGALRILGHYDRPWLDRLDRLLGGVILASGLTPVSALWGWVDQKNEATGLLRKALDAVSGRLTKTGGLARHEHLDGQRVEQLVEHHAGQLDDPR